MLQKQRALLLQVCPQQASRSSAFGFRRLRVYLDRVVFFFARFAGLLWRGISAGRNAML